MCKLAHGRARLSYAHKPNQIFFHTLFRHMVNLGRRRAPSHSPALSRASGHLSLSLPNIAHRRGCPRTAFETARLLLSLEPSSDPTHVLLHIDYYALTAGDPSFVLKLPRMLPSHSLLLYPNQVSSDALPCWDFTLMPQTYRVPSLPGIQLCLGVQTVGRGGFR